MTTSPALTDLPRLASELRLSCMRISRRVRFEPTEGLAPHHFSVLARLEDSSATPGELAEREKISPPSMTRTVAALVDAGLLERRDNPEDRRQVVVSLTPAGRERLDAGRAHRDAWMASRMAELDADEIAILAAAAPVLAKVAAL